MGHTCDACGDEFATLSRLRLHECPEAEEEIFSVRIQARLITDESNRYQAVKDTAGLNEDQPVFPDFDLAVEPDKPVPPETVQKQISDSLDDLFRNEHDLWGWAGTVDKKNIRAARPAGQEVTAFHQVGTIEATESGEIVDTFVSLDELKSAIPATA